MNVLYLRVYCNMHGFQEFEEDVCPPRRAAPPSALQSEVAAAEEKARTIMWIDEATPFADMLVSWTLCI